MQSRTSPIDQLLTIGSRRELQERAGDWSGALTLPNALALTRHLAALEPPTHRLNLGIIHTFTSDLLDPWLEMHAAVQGLELRTYHAPYGLNLMESREGSGLSDHEPDLTLFLLTRDDLHPEFAKPLPAFDPEQQRRLREEAVSRLTAILERFRANVSGRMLVAILPRGLPPGLGLYDAQSDRSEGAWWALLKRDIAADFRAKLNATLFLDLDEMLADIGRQRFFDRRFWYASRFPFSPLAANELARRVMSLAAVSKQPKAKVIALDADNTLWGGIVGEDGITGIALGPDYPGSVYVDFQRRILEYQSRGFVLAICSKNNPEDVRQVLAEHPHQVLRDHHFAAQRVNWQPKHQNLMSLAGELNLGLDSFIFVDDSDHECAIVRRELPQVQVIQTPAKAVEIPGCLERVTRLEVLSLTREDLKKTRLYAEERQRRDLQRDVGEQGGDIRDYLASLKMKMTVYVDAMAYVDRLTQLTQKTNQFNLTTRRYDGQQMRGFLESADWMVGAFSLADIFGDSGIVGLALFRRVDESEAEIDTFLMSCRVIGRAAETAFLEAMLKQVLDAGIHRVVADYLPTQKNRLVADFYRKHGFTPGDDGRFRRNLLEASAAAESLPPIEIEVERGDRG